MLYKFKLVVLGCLCNCVEVICKDIGVVCVDSGYQVFIGGVVGMDVKEIELLVQVLIEEEVIEVVMVVIQVYCEGGKYFDCIYKWLVKVGMDWVKEIVVEDFENCCVLVEWFELSQMIYCKDFWVEYVEKQV